MKNKIIVVDLEGTLSNCNHRKKDLFDNMTQEDYKLWNEQFLSDPPNKDVIAAVGFLSAIFDICVLSCKPIAYKKEVDLWLQRHISFNIKDIYLRPEGCMKTSPEMKEYFCKHIWYKNNEIVLAIDDREDVCKMYKNYGITALQVK